MPALGQRCVALGVIAFIGVAAVRPALAQDAPADAPVVTAPPAPPEAAPAPNPNAGWQQQPPPG